jgi:hypothetical protein
LISFSISTDFGQDYTTVLAERFSMCEVRVPFKSFTSLQKYFGVPPGFVESEGPLEGQRIFDWWCEKRTTDEFPNPSIIARRLFSIPGSAAMSERTWSTVGNIWTPLRNRLQPETVEILTVLSLSDL